MSVRQLRALLPVVLISFLRCASSESARVGPDDDGSGFVEDDSAGAPADRIPVDRQPTQEELAGAFDEPETRRAPKMALTGTGQVGAPPPAEVAEEQAKLETFRASEAKVKALLSAKDAVAARQEADILLEAATGIGPEQMVRALKLLIDLANLQKDDGAAFGHARAWLVACGPQNVARCRSQALSQLSRIAQRAKGARMKSVVADLRTADACVATAERASRKKGAPLPECIEASSRTYRAQGDRLMIARLLAARGESALKVESTVGTGLALLEKAANACDAANCVSVRRRALSMVAAAHQRKGDHEAALKAALREMALKAQTLPASERAYAWTPLVERTCAAVDAARGAGTCRKVERRQVGHHSFKDFSQTRSGEGLDLETVRAVNAHFGVTLDDCLGAQAQRLIPPAADIYIVRWVVQNDGRIAEMHMDKKAMEDGPLAQCMRERLALWRYPRFSGELQHVEQSFTVRAHVRHHR